MTFAPGSGSLPITAGYVEHVTFESGRQAEVTPASGTEPVGFPWRTFGIVLVVVITLVFVVANRSQVPAAWNVVRTASVPWLLLALVCSVAGVANMGFLYGAGQRAAGLDVDIAVTLRLGAAANFLNLVSKSGGLAGLTVFLVDARRRDRRSGSTTAAYVLALTLGEVAFAVLLAVAVVLVAVDGHLTPAEIIAGSLFIVLALARITAIVVAFRSRTMLRRLLAMPGVLRAVFTRRPRSVPDHRTADELFDAVGLLLKRPMAALPAVLHALATEAIGVTMLWAVLGAVHAGHTVSEAFVAYAISVLFEILGFLPGGLGTVEASLGALLVSFGLPIAEAAAVVAVYRVGELWLPMALGALAAQNLRLGGSRV